MRKQKKTWLALSFFLLLISSASPTNSQKGQQDSVPPVKPVPVAKDSAEDLLLPMNGSRLDSVAAKAVKVGKVFDKVDKKSVKASNDLSNLEVRQLKTLHLLIFTQPKIAPLLLPTPSVLIESSPAKPEIKPIEVKRSTWWKRTFGHD